MGTREIIGLIIITLVEWGGLAVWLILILDGDTILGDSTIQYAAATVFLAVLLIVEHFAGFKAFQPDQALNSNKIFKIFFVGISETVLWAVWLFVAKDLVSDLMLGSLLGLVFLAITMFIQHSIESNIFQGRELFNGAPFLFDMAKVKETYDFTLLEVIAGAYWLNFVLIGDELIGLIVLFGGLLVEHIISASTLGGGYRGSQISNLGSTPPTSSSTP